MSDIVIPSADSAFCAVGAAQENELHRARLERVLANLEEHHLEQALICDPLSIWYLTGYYTEPYERFFALLIQKPLDESSQQTSSENLVIPRTTLFCNLLFPDATGHADTLVTFLDTDNPVDLVGARLMPDKVLGVDKDLAARWLVPLMAQSQIPVELASFAVDNARSVKDALEQDLMREASRINDEAMAWLASQVCPGVTELSIAEGLLGTYRHLGAEDHSFAPIVSFGANAADPHHEPDQTAFALGDMVLFDVGCRYKRYCSDMTRTFFTAKPTARQLEIYDTVRRANEAAEALVKPGVLFSQIDLCARKIIEDAGYGPYFNHRLGHQIGLVDHEPGDVSAAHHEAVRPGQVFSIEPGIYLPDEIGVRIEDLLIVTEDGCEVLNHYSKEPTVLELS